MVDDITKAWAAGFFDGEGSIYLTVESRWGMIYLVVEVSQIDKEPIDRLNANWPARIYYYRHKDKARNHRPIYRWTILANKAVKFLADIRLFSARPKVIERIDLALDFQAQKRLTSHRGAAYKALQEEYRARMCALNRRGRDTMTLPHPPAEIDRQLTMFDYGPPQMD